MLGLWRGQPGLVEQGHEQPGEGRVGHPAAPAQLQGGAAAGDAGTAPDGVADQRLPQFVPAREPEAADLVERRHRPAVVHHRTQVHQRPGGAGHRDQAPHPPVDEVPGPRAVDGQTRPAVRVAGPGHGHVDPAGRAEAVEAPQVGGRAVGHDGVVARGQHGGEGAAVPGAGRTGHPVDAGPGDQPQAGSGAAPDRAGRQPDGEGLVASDDRVLAGGDRRGARVGGG